ncbi:taste receptor type 1 member 3 [Elgaria multicarinata webbii]|uniref:taste receptor type 1 member 3 n=1 Tax=Elgaria multicarinata webbii TaxID=159646 RepID=UPI002FCD0D3A
MSAFLLLGVSLDWAMAQDYRCMSSQFRRLGDYMLGGLFPLKVHTSLVTERPLPEVYDCERLYAAGLIWALGMKFAVEEINNSSTLLPGIKLGYDIYDNCMEPVVALQPSLLFLSRVGTSNIGVLCNYTDYQTRVTAVIGPHSSELCTVTAKLFSFFLIPQVSYGATMEKLNNEELYPSFFRTVPSDKNQLEAMVQLLVAFKWNWIAVVGSDNDYGREGLSLLSSMVAKWKICIAYEGLIPADVSNPDLQEKLRRTIRSINDTKVNVVILISSDRPVRALFKVCFELGLSKKVWLATEAWVMSDVVTSLDQVQSIGTVIGFIIKGGNVPGFKNYVYRLLEQTQQDDFCRASKEESEWSGSDILRTECVPCDRVTRHNLSAVLEHRQTFAVYSAVYSVAYALHEALHCETGQCQKRSIKPWQLMDKLRTIQFNVSNQSLHFDQYRSVNMGYEVIGWHWRNSQLEHVSFGDFDSQLRIDQRLVQFHTEDEKAPRSDCLTTCHPGQIRRMKGFHLCCYDCIGCESGTYSSSTEDSTCSLCPATQWSPRNSTRCYERGEKYLFWLEPLALALLALSLSALALTCLAGALFLRNRGTPVVQAAGGDLCLLALLGLGLLCISTGLYVGKPSSVLCQLQQSSLALFLNPCFSTIMAKALQIMLANDFADSRRTFLHTLIQRRPWAVVASSFLVEGLLCFGYLYSTPPMLAKNYKLLPTQVLLHCNIQSWAALSVMHGHNGCLAFVSFLCTFMVETPPKKYNIARGITFGAITFFLALVVFIPTYATVKEELRPAVQMGSILLCVVGQLAAYYLPKSYILRFRPEWNTPDYFQDGAKGRLQEKDSQD